jgi:hypothetical protein
MAAALALNSSEAVEMDDLILGMGMFPSSLGRT